MYYSSQKKDHHFKELVIAYELPVQWELLVKFVTLFSYCLKVFDDEIRNFIHIHGFRHVEFLCFLHVLVFEFSFLADELLIVFLLLLVVFVDALFLSLLVDLLNQLLSSFNSSLTFF